jgi:L-alanine-DL-glutamate epimerase-like enolase superfamily enzyme
MNPATARRRFILSAAVAPQAAAAEKSSVLDIAEIQHFPVREPVSGNRYSLLRVKTRSGVIGWGECAATSDSDLKMLETAWIGKPVHIYAAITTATPFGAALDMALLDIVGKVCNAPVYRVLGGPRRNRIRVFASPAQAGFQIIVMPCPRPRRETRGKHTKIEFAR